MYILLDHFRDYLLIYVTTKYKYIYMYIIYIYVYYIYILNIYIYIHTLYVHKYKYIYIYRSYRKNICHFYVPEMDRKERVKEGYTSQQFLVAMMM